MRVSAQEILDKFSFSDYKVIDMHIYPKIQSILINLSGAACCMDNHIRKDFGKGYIKIEHFSSLRITSYDALKKEENEIEVGKEDKLRELCEIEMVGNKLILKGFAKKSSPSLWLEFEIQGGHLEGEFLDELI